LDASITENIVLRVKLTYQCYHNTS